MGLAIRARDHVGSDSLEELLGEEFGVFGADSED